MLSRISPKQIDNDYRGYQLAIWLLALFLLVKTFAGTFNSLVPVEAGCGLLARHAAGFPAYPWCPL